jgi:uncharacterized protein YndB with AHSA1/START domain
MTMGTSGMARSFGVVAGVVQLFGCVSAVSVSCNPMVARDITIDGDPDEVWEALCDPELLAEWLGEDGQALVEEAEPSERLVLWLVEDDEPGSRVELRLVAVPDGTRVTVTEAPVGPFALAGA